MNRYFGMKNMLLERLTTTHKRDSSLLAIIDSSYSSAAGSDHFSPARRSRLKSMMVNPAAQGRVPQGGASTSEGIHRRVESRLCGSDRGRREIDSTWRPAPFAIPNGIAADGAVVGVPPPHPDARIASQACTRWFGNPAGTGAPAPANPDDPRTICALAQVDLYFGPKPSPHPRYTFAEAWQRCSDAHNDCNPLRRADLHLRPRADLAERCSRAPRAKKISADQVFRRRSQPNVNSALASRGIVPGSGTPKSALRCRTPISAKFEKTPSSPVARKRS